MVELVCVNCGVSFQRRSGEVNRNQKKGRRVVCGRKCQGQINKPNLGDKLGLGRPENLRVGSSLDEYSNFRFYLARAKARAKECARKECLITLEELKLIWDSQDGICPLTGFKLTLKTLSNSGPLTIRHASLDRIDPSKGYTKDNVRFVSVMANYARNTFTDADLIEFCKAVASN